jgi:hypothetical protein
MIAATARTIAKTYASLAGSGFGAMCPLLAPCRTLEGLNGKMCELFHASAIVQEELAIIWVRAMLGTEEGPGHWRPGQVKQSGSKVQFGPTPLCKTPTPLCKTQGRTLLKWASSLSGDLFIYAKDLLVEANGRPINPNSRFVLA